CSRYRMPPCTSFNERLDVPLAKSRASTRPTRRPRVAASSAAPTPTTPPPTTRTSSSFDFSFAMASARSAGPSFDDRLTLRFSIRTPRSVDRRDDHVDPLELLQV